MEFNKKRSTVMRLFLFIVRLALTLALIYAVIEAIGIENVNGFFVAMFAPWVDLVAKHNIDVWGILTHPITLILGALFLVAHIQKLRR